MGYNIQQFINDVDPNLVCGICAGVLEKAVITPCGHSYCGECLETWLQRRIEEGGIQAPCPACRTELFLTDAIPVLALRGIIDGLIVQCPNVDDGCKMAIKLDNIDSHLKACSYEAVQCSGCWVNIRRGQLVEHHASCAGIRRLSCTSYSEETTDTFNPTVEELTRQLAEVESDLRKTKDALNLSKGNVKKLERDLRNMKHRMDVHSVEEDEEIDSDFDPEYNYGYSPQSIAQLSSMISRSLLCKPYYIDRGYTFASIKRCYDYYHNYPGYSQDVHMMLATAYASNWFTESHRRSFEIWLESIARDRYMRSN